VPGTPLQVGKSGSDLALSWDAAGCPGAAVNVYHGVVGDYSTFTGASCDLAPTGSAVIAMPDDRWFLVVSTDGVDTDGSWSRDYTGAELSYDGAGSVCPQIVGHASDGNCP
jgi:hypothetical protein